MLSLCSSALHMPMRPCPLRLTSRRREGGRRTRPLAGNGAHSSLTSNERATLNDDNHWFGRFVVAHCSSAGLSGVGLEGTGLSSAGGMVSSAHEVRAGVDTGLLFNALCSTRFSNQKLSFGHVVEPRPLYDTMSRGGERRFRRSATCSSPWMIRVIMPSCRCSLRSADF